MNEQQELEFKIGEGEEPVDIDMGEDGQSPKIQEGEQAPHVETSGGNAEKPENELNQYSESVKKRIDKLTARLRETQRREEAAIAYARNVQEPKRSRCNSGCSALMRSVCTKPRVALRLRLWL
jgi:hypothetical protein